MTAAGQAATPGDGAPYTVFVNTVDTYDDCWIPFFHLMATYWPDCPQPVVLNTGRKSFSHPELEIHSARGSADLPEGREQPWGERCLRGLEAVETPYVLYMVEDAFIEAPVRTDLLSRVALQMDEHELDCVRIAEPDGAGPHLPSPIDGLWEVDQGAEYLAVLHAALWRTEVLRSLIDPRENPWQFETRGGRRIRSLGRRIHCIDRDRFWFDQSTRIIPYNPVTGIIAGRWREDVVVDLFADHGIDVDLSRRGSEDGTAATGWTAMANRIRGKWRTIRLF